METREIELALPALHAGQARVVAEAKRFNVIAAGVRWGKSRLAIDRLVRTALQGLPCAWFGVSYRNLADVWRELKHILEPVAASTHEQEHRIELIVQGGVIECWSMENIDAVRGRRYGLVVIDEAAHAPNLEEAWTKVIRQRLTDLKGGAWIISTPRGNQNYFARLHARGGDPEYPNWASWRMPTVSNPLIDPAEVEEARRDLMELAFRQEYLAEFVSFTGAVFRKIGDAISPELPAAGPEPVSQYFIGADWGRSNDYTVYVVMDHRRRVVEIDRFRGLHYSLARGRLAALREKWRGAAIVAEANSMGQPIIEDLHNAGVPVIPFVTTNASKAQIIEALALAFEQGRIQIPDDAALVGELQAFESKQLPSGMTRYEASAGAHDDMVMALALANAAADGAEDPGPRIISVRDPECVKYGIPYVPFRQISPY